MVPLAVGSSRVAAVVFVVLVAAMALSGCVASKSDDGKVEVLGEYERSSQTKTRDTIKFDVVKGTEYIRITANTQVETDDSGDPLAGCGQWCEDWVEDNEDAQDQPTGTMTIRILTPQRAEKDQIVLAYDKSGSKTLRNPEAGEWTLDIAYSSGYDGPGEIRVTEQAPPAKASFLGGSFWDIAGIILTVALLVGGAYLYRRRTRFLARELHRIDQTVKLFGTDVEECRTNLRDMQHHLKDLLVKRKIEESHYLILERRIEQYLRDLDSPGNRHDKAPVPRPAKLAPAMAEEEFDLPIEGA